jgi:hypothetical protein
MGNRIHKVLGYGFKYCKYEKDPRFKKEFWDEDFYYNTDIKPILLDYVKNHPDWETDFDLISVGAWLEGKGWYEDVEIPKKLYVSDFIHYSDYNTEGKGIGPVVFSPTPQEKDWCLYDDMINYYDHQCRFKGPKDEFFYIKDEKGNFSGIYPYLNFVNRKTKEKSKIYPAERWLYSRFNSPEHGFDSFISWQRDIVPKIHPTINVFCNALNIFENPLTYLRLKPCLHTYWC